MTYVKYCYWKSYTSVLHDNQSETADSHFIHDFPFWIIIWATVSVDKLYSLILFLSVSYLTLSIPAFVSRSL